MFSVCATITSRTIIRSTCHSGKQSTPRFFEICKSNTLDTSQNSSLLLRTMASSSSSAHSITEVQVPTPWGHLATKCWNLPSTENPLDLSSSPQLPVLCLHGWQDNAGTYDRLIPLLDKVGEDSQNQPIYWLLPSFSTFPLFVWIKPIIVNTVLFVRQDIPFICMDLAGHGKSSPRPLGSCGDAPMYVVDIKRVIDHFGLDKSGLNLMGHSLGGALSICVSATFPKIIRKCLTFDAPALFPRYRQFAAISS